MKIILSRKGFDSSAGKIPSAIIGTKLISFPIPNINDYKDSYDTIYFSDEKNNIESMPYSKIIGDLYEEYNKGKSKEKQLELCEHCHVDPDIKENVRNNKIDNWEPIFGQSGSSATYLTKENEQMKHGSLKVEKGDLFLFFGNYREVILDEEGKFKYKKSSKEMQLIWGWLFVGEKIENPSNNEYKWHPHTYDENVEWEEKNVLFKAKKDEIISIGNLKIPSFGVFDYNPNRVLTANKEYNKNESKAFWKYNQIYDVMNTKHDTRKNSSKIPNKIIYYAGQWQELLLNNFDNRLTIDWLEDIFDDVN